MNNLYIEKYILRLIFMDKGIHTHIHTYKAVISVSLSQAQDAVHHW